MGNENQNNEHAALTVAIDNLVGRFERFENEYLDLRDVTVDLSNAQNRTEATLAILAATLKTQTDKPSQTGALVTAVIGAITVMALALTPVAWLAVNNSARHNEAYGLELIEARERGGFEARLELNEVEHEHTSRELDAIAERIRYLERKP